MFAPLAALLLASTPLPAGHPALPTDAKLVAADPRALQSLSIGLKLPNRAALDAFIAAQHDPASPLFRHWLTPTQFGDRFGVPAGAYENLARTLERAGLKVTRYAGRSYLAAEGTVAQVSQLLGVSFFEVQSGEGAFRSYRGTPSLPDAVASMIQSVGGLDGRVRFKHRLTVRGSNTFGPQDLRRYYDIDLLHAQGYSGQLSKVAVIGTLPNSTNEPSADDVNWFYGNVSNSTAAFEVVHLPRGISQLDGQQGLRTELEMDAELPTVAAPLMQSVTMILGPGNTLFESTYSEIVNNRSDLTAVSASFGGCELEEEAVFPGEMDTVSDLVAQGVSEGIAFFSASGDDGVLTCIQFQDPNTADQPSVDFPSGIPYMTAVGGTKYTGDFSANGAIQTYGSEVTWNEFNQVAGGGGVSIKFPRASFQVAPGTSDGGFREVPDVSLVAALEPGVAIVARSPGRIDGDGNGTSDAAPLTMGIFAAVNDRIGGCRLGTPNFELYALGRWQYGDGGIDVFHDITEGDISVLGSDGSTLVQGPAAGVGYDEATGLGTPDVAALADAWPPCAIAPAPVDGGPEVDGGEPDAGEFDAGASDGGEVDAGPVDGGEVDAGPVDAGPLVVVPWDGGYALDAGVRSAYAPCTLLACDGGEQCVTLNAGTLDEGPSQCLLPCDPNSTGTCAPGTYCETSGNQSFCIDGCGADSDCAGGTVCNLCTNLCVTPGNPDAGVGSMCSRRSDCQTSGFCLSRQFGFPQGYCSQQCSSSCGCPAGSLCELQAGFCFQTCDVVHQTGCSGDNVCDPSTETGDPALGVCLPHCADTNGQCFNGETCDLVTGVCGQIPSGSSSGSSGSTGGSTGSSGSTGGTGSTGGSGTSGSTGTNIGPDGGGCGCGSHGDSGLSWVFALGLIGWTARRRQSF